MNLLLLFESDFSLPDADQVHITGRRLQHIRTVLKAEAGTQLKVGLCNGMLGTGTVLKTTPSSIDLSVALTDTPPPPLPLTLICALPRPKSFKKALATATTLGIKEMVFIGSWRVEKSYWQSPVLLKKSLDEHIHNGLEQARDTILPHISFKKRFKPFVQDELPALLHDKKAYVAHPYNAATCPTSIAQQTVLVIGPEGGFIPYEIKLLQDAGCIPIHIGERILRVETAIAAFAGRFW